jgi:hypothetical protein
VFISQSVSKSVARSAIDAYQPSIILSPSSRDCPRRGVAPPVPSPPPPAASPAGVTGRGLAGPPVQLAVGVGSLVLAVCRVRVRAPRRRRRAALAAGEPPTFSDVRGGRRLRRDLGQAPSITQLGPVRWPGGAI